MPIDALSARVASDGGSPLLTHYDLVEDTRIELSAVTFANWVDKTVNLLDDLGLQTGDSIALPVLSERPDHWVSLVWVFAAWQFGSMVHFNVESADVVVFGPRQRSMPDRTVIGCSLHPLGLACPKLSDGVVDYVEVLAQPDVHQAASRPLTAVDQGEPISFDELPGPCTENGRILVPGPCSPLEAIGALCSVIGSGSLILGRGGTGERWRTIMVEERAVMR